MHRFATTILVGLLSSATSAIYHLGQHLFNKPPTRQHKILSPLYVLRAQNGLASASTRRQEHS